MSVFTVVEREQLVEFLSHYDQGHLVDFQGISDGIENTNYFVTTNRGEFVLTLFEELTWDELPYFMTIMAFLAEHDIPSAHPIADRSHDYLRELNGKPAALVEKLAGRDVEHPNLSQCATIGRTLGHLHLASPALDLYRPNSRGAEWRQQTGQRLLPLLSPEDSIMLQDELAVQTDYPEFNLPASVVHADLFRDNALFCGNELTGIIDFYYACNDYLTYDLAVAVNDWCSQPDGQLDQQRYSRLMSAYLNIRPMEPEEMELWPLMLRAGALRFWLSRLRDYHFPKDGVMTHIKDPTVFRNILEARRNPNRPLTSPCAVTQSTG